MRSLKPICLKFGTLKAVSKPYVILTSNGTRELSDALRRRCLYHYVDYPSFDRELRIVNTRLPNIGQQLSRQIVAFVESLRRIDLRKNPGVAETLDWAAALMCLDINSLDDNLDAIRDSLMCLLKTQEDREALDDVTIERMVGKAI